MMANILQHISCICYVFTFTLCNMVNSRIIPCLMLPHIMPDCKQGIPAFMRSVVNQLILNVNRIHSLGIKKIAVTGMEPAGCLPRNTASNSHQYCIPEGNNLSLSHNNLLNQNLLGLSYNVTYLNIYDAFTTALKLDQNPQGSIDHKMFHVV